MSAVHEHLLPAFVRLDLEAENRREVLKALGELLGGNDIPSQEAAFEDLRARETMGSTGVGGGIAFPHARVSFLSNLRLAFVRTKEPIPFEALDGKPVDLFLALGGPQQGRKEYLAVLAQLSYLFRSEKTRDDFRAAKTPDEVVALLQALSESSAQG